MVAVQPSKCNEKGVIRKTDTEFKPGKEGSAGMER